MGMGMGSKVGVEVGVGARKGRVRGRKAWKGWICSRTSLRYWGAWWSIPRYRMWMGKIMRRWVTCRDRMLVLLASITWRLVRQYVGKIRKDRNSEKDSERDRGRGREMAWWQGAAKVKWALRLCRIKIWISAGYAKVEVGSRSRIILSRGEENSHIIIQKTSRKTRSGALDFPGRRVSIGVRIRGLADLRMHQESPKTIISRSKVELCCRITCWKSILWSCSLGMLRRRSKFCYKTKLY